MTNRVTYAPQDFKKMCEQAERDHESKKLVVLLDRVKKQIAARENASEVASSPKPVKAISGDAVLTRLPSRSAPFDR
jgi:hypothetical protein